jgi:hypothetical protein
MADVNFDRFDGGAQSHGGSQFVHLTGAVISLALIVGAGYWGYKLAVRDIAGIPVVRALEGPMRVAPEEPGGVIAAHQGLSVNSVAADGAASRPSDTLILAPRPVDLTPEDTAGTMAALAPPVSARTQSSAGLELPQLSAPAAPPPVVVGATNAVLSIQEVSLTVDLEEPLAEVEDLVPEASVSLPKGVVQRSPRPAPRPAVRAEVAPVLAALEDSPETDGSALAAGTKLVQLGAFDSAETARSEWQRLSGRFGDLMRGKTRIVQTAQSGGRTFYRLRAEGFANDAESRRFCSALVSEQAACIPVTVR